MSTDDYTVEGTHLDRIFADTFTEYVGYEYKKDGTCENPRCGHHPIHRRFTVKNPDTGETREIGADCCISWCHYHKKPPPPEAGPKYKKAEKKYRDIHGTTEGFAKQWFEQERVKRIQKEYDIKRCDIPLPTFHNVEEANQAAKKYDGYCKSKLTLRGTQYWAVYLPRQLETQFRKEFCGVE